MNKNIFSIKFLVVGVFFLVGVFVILITIFGLDEKVWGAAVSRRLPAPILAVGLEPWQSTTNLPVALRNTVFSNSASHVYAVGGESGVGVSNAGPTSTVRFAHFNSDGTLGPWAETTALPSNQKDHASVVYNNYLYSIGWSAAATRYAQINSDGSLSPWQEDNFFSIYLIDFGLAASNGYMYVVGGINGTTQWRVPNVRYASINPDGSVGAWNTTTALPGPLSDQAVVVNSGYMYVIGGSTGYTDQGVPTSEVWYTTLNSDGSVGAWNTTTALPVSLSDHTAVVYQGNVYVVGGGSSVYYAPINSNGTLGMWSTTSALPTAMSGHGSALNNGYVYALGGSVAASTAVYSKIIVGSVPPPSNLEF